MRSCQLGASVLPTYRPLVAGTMAGPTVSGIGGSVPISSACRSARCRQPRTIAWIAKPIATASTAATISDPTSVPVFMRRRIFRRAR